MSSVEVKIDPKVFERPFDKSVEKFIKIEKLTKKTLK
jgi:hypothetical protein